MANADINIFNFPDLRRYRWRAEDFQAYQGATLDTARGSIEGSFGAAVLEGYEVTPDGIGLHVDVDEGLAAGPSGYLHVHEGVSGFDFTAPVGNPARHLLVARPLISPNTFITKPTAPNVTVPLRFAQLTEIVALLGTPAVTPLYPSTQTGDVIICGVRLQPSQTVITRNDLDFEVRDVIGKNSRIQQNQAKYDNRLRAFRSSSQVVTVKPSQTQVGNDAKAFTYVLTGTPSKFPRSAGLFVFGDTFLNFQSGAITGADTTSADFTPQIPTAGNAIVATLSLRTDDTIQVSYGTIGTRAQCFAAIENATTAGPGSISLLPFSLRFAFVVLFSQNGTAVTELDLIDARTPFTGGGVTAQANYPNVFLSPAGQGDVPTLAAAVASLPASGGVILVMDDVSVPAPVTLPPGTKILGRGRGVRMTFDGASGIIATENCVIEEMLFSAPGDCFQLILNGDNAVVRKCNFQAASGIATAVCIAVQGDGNHIGETVFAGVNIPALAQGIVYLPGAAENTDENCIFTS